MSFSIKSGIKQGCVLAPTLFGTFFAVLLKNASGTVTEGIYLQTWFDGKHSSSVLVNRMCFDFYASQSWATSKRANIGNKPFALLPDFFPLRV